MKYIPPLNESQNAKYKNANVTTGIDGSIVDAKFFNNIQTELLNIITDARITPSDTILNQISEAIQKMIQNSLSETLNGNALLNNNFNNLTESGRYFVHTTKNVTQNAPLNITADWWVNVFIYTSGSNKYILQEARIHTTSESSAETGVAHMLVRCCTNNGWGSWEYSYSQFAG